MTHTVYEQHYDDVRHDFEALHGRAPREVFADIPGMLTIAQTCRAQATREGSRDADGKSVPPTIVDIDALRRAREAYAHIARSPAEGARGVLTKRSALHEVRVCDRILTGTSVSAGDIAAPTKEEVIASIGDIEHTESHE